MRFCNFIIKLKPRFASRSQEAFALAIFSALCGGEAPIGLTGDDATYRKMLFNGKNKKYSGLSSPIKKHILDTQNRDAFIAYCDETVSLKEYPALCGDWETKPDTDRTILFEAIYEQFLEFARCNEDDASLVIPAKVAELEEQPQGNGAVSAAPLYSGDDFAVVTQPRDMTVNFYQDFTVSWTIKNTGSVIWEGRYLCNVNNRQIGVRGVTARVDIPTLRPKSQHKVEARINAQGHEKTSDSIWEIYDGEGNPCFPSRQGEIKVTATVTNPNRKLKTEV